MFIGKPPGNYDRLLDVSHAVTGSLFFVPPATFLDDVATITVPAPTAATNAGESDGQATSKPRLSSADGSLRIGSLKKETGHE
jgi:porphyrinogen peroxidase